MTGSVARPSTLRHNIRLGLVYYHRDRLQSRIKSVPWARLLREFCMHITSPLLSNIHYGPVQWLILVLYGIAGALFAYCVSLFTASPLAAFAICAAYQIIIFTVCFALYLNFLRALTHC